jgi:hypothetical protein
VVPVEAGNATVEKILADLKPEAAYFFADDNGNRSGSIVFDLKDSSRIPAVAKPWFLAFNAKVSFRHHDARQPSVTEGSMDVVVWLRSLGLGKYEALFQENDIDETVLPNLTAEDLKELGVASLGHRRKLLDAIAALRPDTNPAPAATLSRLTPPHGTPPNAAKSR